MVPVLEGTGMGMHRWMHTPHYRYMQREKKRCICAFALHEHVNWLFIENCGWMMMI